MIDYPQTLEPIFTKLQEHNIRPIIVGGFVRDALLHQNSHDIDIELYNIASLHEVESLLAPFGSLNSVGKSFGVVKLLYKGLDLDFSLPRQDSKQASGHKGFVITIDNTLSFKEAARRRDFTMNAIGFDVKSKKILDPYRGKIDLHRRILRAVDLRTFGEDPLRVLRVAVFASRFECRVEAHLYKLCKKMVALGILQELPKERIFAEITKIFLRSNKPSIALQLFEKMGAFTFFAELKTLTNDQKKTLYAALDRAPKDLIIRLALLCSFFTNNQTLSFLKRVTEDKKLTNTVIALTTQSFDLDNYSDYDLYKLATQCDLRSYINYLKALNPKKKASIEGLTMQIEQLGLFKAPLKPLLGGKDLIKAGLKPSKAFQTILQEAYEKQMRGVLATKEDALEWLQRGFILS